MKRIGPILLAIMLFGAVLVGLSRCFGGKDEETPTEPSMGEIAGGEVYSVYSIDYVAVTDYGTSDIKLAWKKANGEYPSSYYVGTGATVSELENIVYVSQYEKRMFCGWFLDSACTQPFNGTVSETQTGNITLYADIRARLYNIEYVGVLYGERTDIMSELYLTKGTYPTEYIAGQGATVSDLREYYPVTDLKDIAFYGWYLDEACTQPFDGTIEETQTGNVTLYAKLVYWMWTPNY